MSEMEDWNWATATGSTVGVTTQDARFILAACCQWVPENDIATLIRLDATDYEHAPILRLMKKTLPVLIADGTVAKEDLSLSVGEISFILHYLRGDDSYDGGARFEKTLLKALHDVLKGAE